MLPADEFPALTEGNHRITSPADVGYNCVAWAARDARHWWQPGLFWPVEALREEHGIGDLERAFQTLGYEDCPDGSLEPGIEKSFSS